MPTTYPFDPTGLLASNLISNEQHVLAPANGVNFHILVPDLGPYFESSMVVTLTDGNGVVRTLTKGIDWQPTHWFLGASRACALPIYGSVNFLDLTLQGLVKFTYQTLGGDWVISAGQIATILSDTLRNPRITAWEDVSGYPTIFPPVPHEWNLTDMVGMSSVVTALAGIETALIGGVQTFADRMAAKINGYTKTEVDAIVTVIDQAIAAEALARSNQDATLGNAINAEATARVNLQTTVTQLIANLTPNNEDEIYFATQSKH